jgi:hypothetical protein
MPETYLFRGSDWARDKSGLLARHHYPNSKEAEYGIHCSGGRQPKLDRYRFEVVIGGYE